jgi:hypothetical protein
MGLQESTNSSGVPGLEINKLGSPQCALYVVIENIGI